MQVYILVKYSLISEARKEMELIVSSNHILKPLHAMRLCVVDCLFLVDGMGRISP